jgi:acyl carrier protein
MSVFCFVKKILENQVTKEIPEIKLDTLVSTLGLDSLDTLDFVVQIEDDLDILLDIDNLPEFKVVSDIVDFLEEEVMKQH